MKSEPIILKPQNSAENLPIVGVTQFTTIDYPGALAAVFYTQGCTWRCRYCHNSHLREIQESPPDKISWQKLEEFMDSRKNFLEAIVFCGGEPTLHRELRDAMQAVKDHGYRVGLHTAGMSVEMFERVLPLCDWVGMDVKAPFGKYEAITGVPGSGEHARKSVSKLISSGTPHEFRTTVHPELLNEEDIRSIATVLHEMGAQHYVLQSFRAAGCPDQKLNHIFPGAWCVSGALEQDLRALFEHFEIRAGL